MLQMVFRRGLSEIGGAEVRTVSGLRDYDAGEHCDQPVSSLLVKGCSQSADRGTAVEAAGTKTGPRRPLSSKCVRTPQGWGKGSYVIVQCRALPSNPCTPETKDSEDSQRFLLPSVSFRRDPLP